ncbi:hypothetical protein EJ07DRAFT_159815 [Lizonia empirigonia]|nr:hypothetical protein EJ07DRAFT_159815 [Lizonia empirigonia]
MQPDPPVLAAISSSARQLFTLLRCIAFAPKAHVQLTDQGLRFSVDEASAMEASAFLDKSLFTTYTFHAPPVPPSSADLGDEDAPPPLTFHISLTALLETLQIFGLTDPNASRPPWARDNPYPTSTAFSNNVLVMNNLCRITYEAPGSPLSVILTEASIRTSCDLTTYEPEYTDEIPFDRHTLAFKTIMRGSWLLLETFQLADPHAVLRASYKFALVQKAARAMSVAAKVSVRVDAQGVLSLQFLVEGEAGSVSFVDFRFVPLLDEEGEGEGETVVGGV